MIALENLETEELTALKEKAVSQLESLNREVMNQQYRLEGNRNRQLNAAERLTTASTEVDTFSAILSTLQSNNAPESQIREYQNKLDLATLRLKIAQSTYARYSDVELLLLEKEVIATEQRQASYQSWISEIDQLING